MHSSFSHHLRQESILIKIIIDIIVCSLYYGTSFIKYFNECEKCFNFKNIANILSIYSVSKSIVIKKCFQTEYYNFLCASSSYVLQHVKNCIKVSLKQNKIKIKQKKKESITETYLLCENREKLEFNVWVLA